MNTGKLYIGPKLEVIKLFSPSGHSKGKDFQTAPSTSIKLDYVHMEECNNGE